MRASRAVLKAKAFDLVAELRKRGRGRASGKSRAHYDHIKLSLVGGVYQLDVVTVLAPLLGKRSRRCSCVEFHKRRCSHFTIPARIEIGIEQFPRKIKIAETCANVLN